MYSGKNERILAAIHNQLKSSTVQRYNASIPLLADGRSCDTAVKCRILINLGIQGFDMALITEPNPHYKFEALFLGNSVARMVTAMRDSGHPSNPFRETILCFDIGNEKDLLMAIASVDYTPLPHRSWIFSEYIH
jgi:hypothetical protein